jgi:hypothetical protein
MQGASVGTVKLTVKLQSGIPSIVREDAKYEQATPLPSSGMNTVAKSPSREIGNRTPLGDVCHL